MHNLKKSGGSRQGSGAKPKYDEPTTTIAFRVPVSKVETIKETVKTMLSEWESNTQENGNN